MTRRVLTFLLIICVFHNTSQAIDYGQFLAKKVKAAFGSDFKKYTFKTYPVNNFGLATCYGSSVAPEKIDCATWECLGLNDEDVAKLTDPQRLELIVKNKAYATIARGAPLSLTEDETKAVGIKAILPALLQIIGLDVNVSISNKVNTKLSLGKPTLRIIRIQPMSDLLISPSGHQLAKKHWEEGKLVMVYSDIVVDSMKVELTVNPQTDVELAAKLNQALVGKIGKVIGADADLSFKLNNATNGTYKFELAEPLIVAVYTKKVPKGNAVRNENDWVDEEVNANKVVGKTIDLGELP